MSITATIRRVFADFIAQEGREAARRETIALPQILAAAAIVMVALAAMLEG